MKPDGSLREIWTFFVCSCPPPPTCCLSLLYVAPGHQPVLETMRRDPAHASIMEDIHHIQIDSWWTAGNCLQSFIPATSVLCPWNIGFLFGFTDNTEYCTNGVSLFAWRKQDQGSNSRYHLPSWFSFWYSRFFTGCSGFLCALWIPPVLMVNHIHLECHCWVDITCVFQGFSFAYLLPHSGCGWKQVMPPNLVEEWDPQLSYRPLNLVLGLARVGRYD